ncbi:MAG: hypothetical protein QM495_02515 [Lutibacter sp.]|uniref:hypothetical protein n=1 Tax=Lutibacter sp. TaxID=1925666 RepID=UPI00385B654C
MKDDKKLDDFTRYIIKETQIETPSDDFLNNVMTSVKLEHELSLVKVYKPLISKTTWILITIVFIAISSYILTVKPMDNRMLFKLDFSFLDKLSSFNLFENILSINVFESIHFSNTFTFSFVFFSVLVIIQLFVIKNFVNKNNTIL